MKRPFVLSLLLAAISTLAFPALSQAKVWDQLLEDVQHITESFQTESGELLQLEVDNAFTGDAELFPRDRAPGTGSAEAAPVTVSHNGEGIVLADVPPDSWFAPYVRDMVQKRILSGYLNSSGVPNGTFGPEDSITVEQLAKMAVLSAGTDTSACPQVSLNLVAKGTWSQSYIACAESLKWTVYADGTVDLKRPATRSEVVLTVLEAFKVSLRPATGTMFTDVPRTLEMRDAIETAAQDGVVNGYRDANGVLTGLFGPLDAVNRAEAAKILSLGMQIYVKK